MKGKKILAMLSILTIFVSVSCAASEAYWSNRRNSPDLMRQLVGLPSESVGNLNPSARNPGLELLCPALNDIPGGYCYYFSPGTPLDNYYLDTNITVSAYK